MKQTIILVYKIKIKKRNTHIDIETKEKYILLINGAHRSIEALVERGACPLINHLKGIGSTEYQRHTVENSGSRENH